MYDHRLVPRSFFVVEGVQDAHGAIRSDRSSAPIRPRLSVLARGALLRIVASIIRLDPRLIVLDVGVECDSIGCSDRARTRCARHPVARTRIRRDHRTRKRRIRRTHTSCTRKVCCQPWASNPPCAYLAHTEGVCGILRVGVARCSECGDTLRRTRTHCINRDEATSEGESGRAGVRGRSTSGCTQCHRRSTSAAHVIIHIQLAPIDAYIESRFHRVYTHIVREGAQVKRVSSSC
jgi:hypothetical protein